MNSCSTKYLVFYIPSYIIHTQYKCDKRWQKSSLSSNNICQWNVNIRESIFSHLFMLSLKYTVTCSSHFSSSLKYTVLTKIIFSNCVVMVCYCINLVHIFLIMSKNTFSTFTCSWTIRKIKINTLFQNINIQFRKSAYDIAKSGKINTTKKRSDPLFQYIFFI